MAASQGRRLCLSPTFDHKLAAVVGELAGLLQTHLILQACECKDGASQGSQRVQACPGLLPTIVWSTSPPCTQGASAPGAAMKPTACRPPVQHATSPPVLRRGRHSRCRSQSRKACACKAGRQRGCMERGCMESGLGSALVVDAGAALQQQQAARRGSRVVHSARFNGKRKRASRPRRHAAPEGLDAVDAQGCERTCLPRISRCRSCNPPASPCGCP